jgi:hypothetical protein
MPKLLSRLITGVNMALAKIIISAKMNCDLEVFSS